MTLIVLCLLLSVLGCTPHDGTDPYVLWETYEDPEFHFRYLSPPFEVLSEPSSMPVLFAVDSDEKPFPMRGMPCDGIGARLCLETVVVEDILPQDAARQDLEDWKNRGAQVEPPEPFESVRGDIGVRIWSRSSDRWITACYQGLPAGDTVVMKIVGKHNDLDGSDILLLLQSLEPRPLGGK